MATSKEGEDTSRLRVFLRIRPINQRDFLKSDQVSVVATYIDEHTVFLVDSTDCEDVLRHNREKGKYYEFDYVFDEKATQHQVFKKTTRQLIDPVINGFNTTVFAYGATGAGKTYTMMGTEANPGIMSLTIVELFSTIEKMKNNVVSVTMSYLEASFLPFLKKSDMYNVVTIYNENIRDLLSDKIEVLDLREDGARGAVVVGITQIKAESADQVLGLLKKGNKHRMQEATGANEASSRSHAVLQVIVENKEKYPGSTTNKEAGENGGVNHALAGGIRRRMSHVGKLSMIDLAGSERASETNNTGLRMKEGANINRSLLALGNCINALTGGTHGKAKYVNFRDSKLTRLLKDSLSGNCKTVMIANISPTAFNYDDTHNTLKYAARAGHIKTKIKRQLKKTNTYENMIEELKGQIQELKKTALATTSTKFSNAANQSRPVKMLPPIPSRKETLIMADSTISQSHRQSVELPTIQLTTRPLTESPRTAMAIKKSADGMEPKDVTWLRGTLWDMFGKRLQLRKQQQKVDEERQKILYQCSCFEHAISKLEQDIEFEQDDITKLECLKTIEKLKESLENLNINENHQKILFESYKKKLDKLDTKLLDLKGKIGELPEDRHRELLDLILKVCTLQNENIELETSKQKAIYSSKQKNVDIFDMVNRENLLEKIIQRQQVLIEENNIEKSESLEHLLFAMKRRKGMKKISIRNVLSPVSTYLHSQTDLRIRKIPADDQNFSKKKSTRSRSHGGLQKNDSDSEGTTVSSEEGSEYEGNSSSDEEQPIEASQNIEFSGEQGFPSRIDENEKEMVEIRSSKDPPINNMPAEDSDDSTIEEVLSRSWSKDSDSLKDATVTFAKPPSASSRVSIISSEKEVARKGYETIIKGRKLGDVKLKGKNKERHSVLSTHGSQMPISSPPPILERNANNKKSNVT